MHIRSYRARFGALAAALALVGVFAIPTAASAQSCTVCLSSGGDVYYPSGLGGSPNYTGNPSPYDPGRYSTSPSSSSAFGGYGSISETTGLPRTEYVSGYTRSDGTYVDPYYRSHR
jgi:hypothetical protein